MSLPSAIRRRPLPNLAPVLFFVELLLGLVGAAIAYFAGIPLSDWLTCDVRTCFEAAAGLGPMLGLFALTRRSQWRPLVRLRRQVRLIVRAILAGAQPWELALTAAAAGIGEEFLFRGALQPLAARWVGGLAALGAVSLLFGAFHAVSPLYFAFAAVVGAYLGWLSVACESLTVPILVHAIYDWIALAWFHGQIRPAEFVDGRRSGE